MVFLLIASAIPPNRGEGGQKNGLEDLSVEFLFWVHDLLVKNTTPPPWGGIKKWGVRRGSCGGGCVLEWEGIQK